MWGSAYIVQAHGILAIRTFSQGLDPGNSVRTKRRIEETGATQNWCPHPLGKHPATKGEVSHSPQL